MARARTVESESGINSVSSVRQSREMETRNYARRSLLARPRNMSWLRSRTPFLLGSDCSGLEAPLLAAQALSLQCHHMWSSDLDDRVAQFIRQNYEPRQLFRDLTNRRHESLPSLPSFVISAVRCALLENPAKKEHTSSDLTCETCLRLVSRGVYTAGFPCQSYSTLGLRRGLQDASRAAALLLRCMLHSADIFTLAGVTCMKLIRSLSGEECCKRSAARHQSSQLEVTLTTASFS